MKANELYGELTAWTYDPEDGCPPSTIDDPEGLLAAAIAFEEGNFSCSFEQQAEKARKDIRVFCEQTEDYD